MERFYSHQTSVGPFFIVKRAERYHAVYFDISILSCYRAEEVAAVLGYGYKFSLIGTQLGEIDTSKLGIPPDLSDWTRCYFAPSNVRRNFELTSEHDTNAIGAQRSSPDLKMAAFTK